MPEAVCGMEVRRGGDQGGGTLGCFLSGNFYRCRAPVTALLTNRHVLEGQDPSKQNELSNKTIEQSQDLLRDNFKKGAYYVIVKNPEIQVMAWYNKWHNPMSMSDDFAIAVLNPNLNYKNQANGTTFSGVKAPEKGMDVRKFGALTGMTEGRIVEVTETQFVVEGNNGRFAQKGDSGSAIFTPGGEVVGLLFGFGGTEDIRRLQTDVENNADEAVPAARRNSAFKMSYVIETLNRAFPGANVTLGAPTGQQGELQR